MLSLSHFTAMLLTMVFIITSMSVFATSAPPPLQQGEQPMTAAINSTTYTDDTGSTVDLPPGWTAADQDNTGEEAREIAASQLRETLVEVCPLEQSAVNTSTALVRCMDDFGIVRVSRYVNMDINPDFAPGTSSVDPSTGLRI
jgi:hypothetical protein